MTSALPIQVATPEGTPTIVNAYGASISSSAPIPSPAVIPALPSDNNNAKPLFNFDSWLETNKLSHLKDIFIKHNMTTYNSISTIHPNFALLISEQIVISTNILSTVVMAIQKLHTIENQKLRNTEAIDSNRSSDIAEYIVVSSDEHRVLQSLKQSLSEMSKIKTELTEISDNYIQNKNKTETNKSKCIELCKEKIQTVFWNLTEIIKNRRQCLLATLDEIHLKQLNDKNNKIIEINMSDIKNEICIHERYINDKISEYKSLIQTTKSSYTNMGNIDVSDDTKKVRVRRHSIIKMGNDTQNLHARQTKHIIAEFSKLKQSINNELIERNIDFILDTDYLNAFLVNMSTKFGNICENIPRTEIVNIAFESQTKERLIIDLNNCDYESEFEMYQILKYEIAYFYKTQNDNGSDEKEEKSVRSSHSESSDLFTHHITEGGQEMNDENENSANQMCDILWKLTEINTHKKDRIKCKIERSDSKCVEFMIKIRSYLKDTKSELEFWTEYSHDFVLNFKEIKINKNNNNSFGTPKHLPKWKQTPNSGNALTELEMSETEEKMSEIYFEKFYTANVFDPNSEAENSIIIHSNAESPLMTGVSHSANISQFSNLTALHSGINALAEDNEEFESSMVSPLPSAQDMIHKSKSKQTKHKKKQKSWSHSLNRRLSGLFGKDNSISIAIDQETHSKKDSMFEFEIPLEKWESDSAKEPSQTLSKKEQKKLRKKEKKAAKKLAKKAKKQNSKRARAQSDELSHRKLAKRKQSHIELLQSNNTESDTFKILLLGGLGSGKTTVFKQLQCIKGIGFDERMRKDFRILIYEQILDALLEIIDKIEELREEMSEDYNANNKYYINYKNKTISKLVNYIQNKLTANEILKCVNNNSAEALHKIKQYLLSIWKLAGIQNVFIHKRNEIENLGESVQYFMNNIDRVLSHAYIPSVKDVLFVRNRTCGINKVQLELDTENLCIDTQSLRDKTSVTICEVGGSTAEQKKWHKHFIGTTAVIYIVSLSGFDERRDDTYQLKRELKTFEKFLNNEQLRNVQWILFLNKIDLFVNKIKSGKTINICFNNFNDDFDDNSDKNIDKSIKYICEQFSFVNKRGGSNNKLYTHITCAIEQKFMKKVIDDTLHIIINYTLLNSPSNNAMH